MPRGMAAIALDRPKCVANLGGVLRAAGCFNADLVVVRGTRIRKFATDTMRAYKHIPCVDTDDLFSVKPFGAVPVGVELTDKARDLRTFTHPESAFYVFGPEDGSVSADYLEKCAAVIRIPSGCLNLAAAVNIVLYDRLAKSKER